MTIPIHDATDGELLRDIRHLEDLAFTRKAEYAKRTRAALVERVGEELADRLIAATRIPTRPPSVPGFVIEVATPEDLDTLWGDQAQRDPDSPLFVQEDQRTIVQLRKLATQHLETLQEDPEQEAPDPSWPDGKPPRYLDMELLLRTFARRIIEARERAHQLDLKGPELWEMMKRGEKEAVHDLLRDVPELKAVPLPDGAPCQHCGAKLGHKLDCQSPEMQTPEARRQTAILQERQAQQLQAVTRGFGGKPHKPGTDDA